MQPRRFWQEMTTGDFAGAAAWIAVLPLAAVEQHGPHLPLATDAMIADGMVQRAIALMPDDLPVTFLPTQAIGDSGEHGAAPGTLSAEPETLLRLVLDIGAGVAAAGVRKVILINAHGGNVPVLDIAAKQIRLRHTMLAVATGWSRLGVPPGLFSADELAFGIHGGDIETSIMLHLRPDLVRMAEAKRFPSAQSNFAEEFRHLRAYGPVGFGWRIEDLNPAGAVGDAQAATAAKGRSVIDHRAAAFVELCRDVHRFDLARLWKP